MGEEEDCDLASSGSVSAKLVRRFVWLVGDGCSCRGVVERFRQLIDVLVDCSGSGKEIKVWLVPSPWFVGASLSPNWGAANSELPPAPPGQRHLVVTS
jgi:hypothetical protein